MAAPASRSGAGRFISAARVFTALTMVSRVFGLIRDKVCAYQFGNGDVWSAFMFAFAIPNLFRRLFGEGALSSVLVPVLTDYDRSDDPARQAMGRQLVGAVITLLTMLLAAITLAIELVLLALWRLGDLSAQNKLVVGLTAVMLPYVILVCLVAAISAVLNVRGRFAEGAAAPILLNLCIIAAAAVAAPLLAERIERQIFVVAAAVLAAGFAQLALVWRAMHARGFRYRPSLGIGHPGVKKIAVLMAPMVAGLSVMQLNSLMDLVIAWGLTARPGHQAYTWLGLTIPRVLDAGAVSTITYSARFYELPLGLFSVALATAIFPALSRHARDADFAGLADTLRRGLEIALLIAVPATAGLLLIRVELVQLILQGNKFTADDTQRVAFTMSFYVLGLAFFSVQQLLIRAFYSLKRVGTPIKVGAAMVALNLPLNLTLVWFLGTGGLALSTTVCAAIQTLLLGLLLRRLAGRLGGRRIAASLVKTLIATAAMAAAVYISRAMVRDLWGYELAGLIGRAGKVLLPVAVGAAVFLLSARLLRSDALRELLSRER